MSTLLAVLVTGVIVSPPLAFAADAGPGFSGPAGYVGAARVNGAPAYCIDADLPSPVGAESVALEAGQPEPERLAALDADTRARLHWLLATHGATDDPAQAAAVTILIWSIVGAADGRGDERPLTSVPAEHQATVRALLTELRATMAQVRVAEPLIAPQAQLIAGPESARSIPAGDDLTTPGGTLIGGAGAPAPAAAPAGTSTASPTASPTTPPAASPAVTATGGTITSAPSSSTPPSGPSAEPGLPTPGPGATGTDDPAGAGSATPPAEATLRLGSAPSGMLVRVELDGATFTSELGGQRSATLSPEQQVAVRIDAEAETVAVRLTAVHEPMAWTPELRVFLTPNRQSLIQAPAATAPASTIALTVANPSVPPAPPTTTPPAATPPTPTPSESPAPEAPPTTAAPSAPAPDDTASPAPPPLTPTPTPTPAPTAGPTPGPTPGGGDAAGSTPTSAPIPSATPQKLEPSPSPSPRSSTDSLAHTGGDAAGMLIGAGAAIAAVGIGGWLLSRRFRHESPESRP